MRSDKYKKTTEESEHSRVAKKATHDFSNEAFEERERAREAEKQAKVEKKAKHHENWNKFTRILSVLYFVLVVLFVWLITWLNVLPGKYYWPMVIVLGFITLITVPAMFSKRGKMGRKIIATLLSFVMIFGCAFGSFYMAKTMWLLNDITDVEEKTEDYHIIGHANWTVFTEITSEPEPEPTKQSKFLSFLFDKKDKDAQEEPPQEVALFEKVDDFSYITVDEIGTYLTTDHRYSEAKAKLTSELACSYTYEQNINDLVSKFKAEKLGYIFISNATYEGLKLEDESFEEAAIIVYTIKLPIEDIGATNAVDVTSEAFNIFISGSDVTGTINQITRSDVNMIVTVNPVTHEVLLTSIPRDYHVMLHSKQSLDKLTHASLYGVEESAATIEDAFGIDINYYLRVNFTTLIKLVDAIGGVDVESDYAFTTSGMGKDMKYLNNIHFVKGKNHLDGNKALAFCRERHSFSDGDMQRNKNQQKVIEAIIKKAASSKTILTSYSDILNALKGKMETNMTTEEMSKIIKAQLSTMPSWDVEKQSIKGKVGFGYCYSLGFDASVVFQDEVQNAKLADAIYSAMLVVKDEETDGTQETTAQ